MSISQNEMKRLEAYLQTTFGCERLEVRPRSQTDDSVEVLINNEFIGVIYKDEEEGETSYDFNMAILSIDLPG